MKNATEKWIKELHDVMAVLDAPAILQARDRATIRRACAESIVAAEDRLYESETHRNMSSKWGLEDIATLERELASKIPPTNYAQERIVLEELSVRLGRPEKFVKRKAIELGLGRKVDCWVNRSPDE